MSECSEATPSVDDDGGGGVDAICMKIHKKLTMSLERPLLVSAHKSSVSYMLKARDSLLRGASLSASSKVALLCSGITCMKRVTFEIDAEDQIALLKKTQALIFSLLVMAEPQQPYAERDEDHGEGHGEGHGEDHGEDHGEEMRNPNDDGQPTKRRRVCVKEETQLIASWHSRTLAERIDLVDTTQSASSCDNELKSDAIVRDAVLKEARYVNEPDAMKQISLLSDVFFRCAASVMMKSLFDSQVSKPSTSTESSFLTLDTIGLLNNANEMQDEKLTALVDVAESEAGQTVLRDMILSFKLPTKAIGVRRCVFLSRESNAFATKQYPEILNGAHEAAMRGSVWSFESDPDRIHKMCAILAGLALVISKDDIRKGSAFGGRVVLPFIDCPPVLVSVTRLALIPETGDWVVYTTDSGGNPKIKYKHNGYEGFCECVLILCKSLLK